VLLIFGMKDAAFVPATLNGTGGWIDGKFELVTLPQAAHFVQQDAAEQVTRTMVRWLADK
jgi:epoxide hydrolase 4